MQFCAKSVNNEQRPAFSMWILKNVKANSISAEN